MKRQTVAALLLTAGAFANALAAEEVPYVQTPAPVVDAMLLLGSIRKDDVLIDLGSGDGRIVITAARRDGARALGIELDDRLVKLANERARAEGVGDRARFVKQDLYTTDLSAATVITMYLLPDANLELRPRLLDLKPGTRIVSHDFDMGDWRPDAQLNVPAPGKTVGIGQRSNVYMWTIPAKVEGRWAGTIAGARGVQPLALDINRRFQDVLVEATVGGANASVTRAKLRGPDLSFGIEVAGTTLAVATAMEGDRLVGEALAGERRYPVVLKRVK